MNATISTKLGPVQIQINPKLRIHVASRELVLRNIIYRFHFNLILVENQLVAISNEGITKFANHKSSDYEKYRACSIGRLDDWSKEPSDSARTTIFNEVLSAIQEWYSKNAGVVKLRWLEFEKEDCQNDINFLIEKNIKLANEIEENRKKIDDLNSSLLTLTIG